jgi:hypothetical protein
MTSGIALLLQARSRRDEAIARDPVRAGARDRVRPTRGVPIRASATRVSVGLTMLAQLALCSKPQRGAALCLRVIGAITSRDLQALTAGAKRPRPPRNRNRREAAAPGQSRCEASDRSRETSALRVHDHVGRDADGPAMHGDRACRARSQSSSRVTVYGRLVWRRSERSHRPWSTRPRAIAFAHE